MGKGSWERKEREEGDRGDRWQGPGHVQMRTVMQTGPHRHAVCGVCSIKHREPLARVFPATEFLIRLSSIRRPCLSMAAVNHSLQFYLCLHPLLPYRCRGNKRKCLPPYVTVQQDLKVLRDGYCADMESKGPGQWGTMRPVQPPRRETSS